MIFETHGRPGCYRVDTKNEVFNFSELKIILEWTWTSSHKVLLLGWVYILKQKSMVFKYFQE